MVTGGDYLIMGTLHLRPALLTLIALLASPGCVMMQRKTILPPPPRVLGPNRYRIPRPVVQQRLTEYRRMTFQPGDIIRINAGGCVQTGGRGLTWKHYVAPKGPNSSRLYHGLIWIPGVTPGLVR